MIRNLKNAFYVLLVALTGASLLPIPSQAFGRDYRFEIVDKSIHAGAKMPVHVKLVQISTGKVISGAVVAEPKLIMLMPGAADMDGHVVKMPVDANGHYRFAADVVAPGEWILNLSAQVPGEKETVQSSLKFQVVK